MVAAMGGGELVDAQTMLVKMKHVVLLAPERPISMYLILRS